MNFQREKITKYFLLLFIAFIFVACDSSTTTKDDNCSASNTTGKCEDNKVCNNGICEAVKTCKNSDCDINAECVENECKCKAGYIDFENECIVNLCVEPNPCKDENQSICKAQKDRPYFTCECDADFHLENGKCVTNIGDPCHPNPCTEETKTRCLWDPEDNTKAICHCDAGLHTDGDLCCPPITHNENGACVCNEGYLPDPENAGECKVLCSEDSVPGFNGICENPNEICVQGICSDNRCIDYECPENSECSTQNDNPECYCNEGLHMDNNLCCTANASNINETCQCDTGYILTNGKCELEETNPCFINPDDLLDTGYFACNEELHKNKCIVDDSVIGFHCECNIGFSLNDITNKCELTVVDTCPNDLICLNDYCVEAGDRVNEQCLTDEDCHEFNASATSICNANVVGGVCTNCQTSSDCPANTYCEESHNTCKNECDSDSDCPSGRCSGSLNICLIATCTTNDDCQSGSVCIKDNVNSNGLCNRIPCNETACSEFNPNGSCEDGKSCIYGSCIDSCNPNPCTQTPLKTICNNNAGLISCACESGYTENEAGECIPETVSSCPTGFTCENGYCADRSDNGFICANDTDCGPNTNCSTPMTLPSGKCTGCTVRSDCPHEGDNNTMECLAGYCLATCSLQSDCNEGMTCDVTSGFCKTKTCATAQDCPTGYVCDGDSLKCERMPCSQ